MKKFVLAAIAATVLCGGPAFAADLPAKAPVYTKAPIYAPVDPWTGFYVGGSLGARWSQVDWTTIDFDAIAATSDDNPAHLNDTSFRVGAYAGYNWLFAPSALVGLEADLAWGNNNKTRGGFPGAGNTTTDPTTNFITAKLGWDGSIRGRVGFLASPNWLAYATGGVAWQQIETDSICTSGVGNSFCAGVSTSGPTSTTKTGWTAGGGVETLLLGNWIARVEYRYADFGHVTNRLPPTAGGGFHANVDVQTHTALMGLAYKF